MAIALLAAGQRVSVSGFGASAMPGVFRIVRALPADGRPQQYRIKSDTESFERVVDASRLEAMALA
jgi:hypothetical protein